MKCGTGLRSDRQTKGKRKECGGACRGEFVYTYSAHINPGTRLGREGEREGEGERGRGRE